MKEDARFLNALISNDSTIIKEIYTRIFPKVEKFVLQNKGRASDAEDVFQKALLQLAARYKKERFEIVSSFDAYLFTVCKNLWRRELNKSKRKVTIDPTPELRSEEQDMALALLEQKRWELFQETFQKISENCQKILKMFFQKVPYAEIVKVMSYNSETVARQRVFKCKTRLTELVHADVRYHSLREL
ncbi:MAG: sigma-70 family RNA polymerase sigma factor [Flavobacteriaceae bacterium]|nr:sigma-70 family RNA polymerase sigma factor [Flavobacteriaceae bacterium]